MVPKGVLLVCILWVGTLSAMPSHNDDNYYVPLRRNFHDGHEDSHLDRNVPRHRENVQSSYELETAESQHYDKSNGRPSGFPDFASIGGLRELQEGSAVASGSFNHNLVFPKVHIPDISIHQPMFRENFPFRKQTNEAVHKTITKRDTNKVNPTMHERSVKKELTHSRTSGDQLTSQSAQIPLHRIFGRKDANPESYVTHTRVPRQYIHYPVFDRRDPIFDRRDRAESINSPFTRENIFLNQRHLQALEEEKLLNQRFFPSFPDGRFFGPAPIPQPAIQVASGGHRGRSSNKEFSKQRPFRASTKTSHNSFNDFEPVDNSILGSGNFEVIKGGTFYDSDDPHLNHNPYDPYLDNSYVVFPSGNPPSSNHVDDFFQNFRDFSEFATRRSDSNHFDESPNDGYLASGFSEHIPSIVSIDDDMMTSESNPQLLANSTTNYEIIRTINIKNNANTTLSDLDNEFSSENEEKSRFLKPQLLKKYLFKNKKDNKRKVQKTSQERKRPKNIQDVLEQIDQNEQINDSIKDNYDATDPLIAIF